MTAYRKELFSRKIFVFTITIMIEFDTYILYNCSIIYAVIYLNLIPNRFLIHVRN